MGLGVVSGSLCSAAVPSSLIVSIAFFTGSLVQPRQLALSFSTVRPQG